MPITRIRTEGFQKVIAHLEGIDAKSDNLSVPLRQAGVMMLRSIDSNFSSQGRPVPWRMLSFGYLKSKTMHGYGNLILQKTGQLRRSISFDVDPNKLTIGTSVFYGQHHQFGTSRMPMRKFLVFQDDDINQIKKLVNDYMGEP